MSEVGARRNQNTIECLERRVLFAAGDLDTTFGGGQGFTFDNALGCVGQDIVTLSNGKIILVGRSGNDEFCLFRNKTNGDLDTAFGTDDNNSATVTAIQNRVLQSRRTFLLSSGKVMVVGEQFDPEVDPQTEPNDDARIVFARYDVNGNPDVTFGNQGVKVSAVGGATFGAVRDVAIQKDGKFIAVGKDGNAFIILRYLANGNPDATFGTGGKCRVIFSGGNAFADTVVVQKDGKILVGGSAKQDVNGNGGIFALTRLTTAGKFDPTFGSGGVVRTDDGGAGVITSLVVQSDGKIVAAGASGDTILNNTHAVLIRYSSNGKLDKTFGSGGILAANIGATSFATQVALDGTGQIIFTGYTNGEDLLVGRVLANGKGLDPKFNPTGGNGPNAEPTFAPQVKLADHAITPLVQTGDSFLDFINDSRARLIPQKGKILILVTSSNGTELARVFNDSLKPISALVTVPAIAAVRSTVKFTVKFSDNIAVQVSTLGSEDFLVTGPGYQVPATVVFVSVDKTSNGSPRVATYKLSGPNGQFTRATNGTYAIHVQANQVSDLAQNFVSAKIVKKFTVNIAAKATASTKIATAAQTANASTAQTTSTESPSVASALFATTSSALLRDDDYDSLV